MIVAAGLSPAWQRIMQFDRLIPGEVNRANRVVACASGKVLNVGRACHHLGADVLTVSPVGGEVGEQIVAEFARDQLRAVWISSSAPTRTCTTLLDVGQGTVTELVENALPLTVAEVDAFVVAFREAALKAEVVILTGSLPPPVGGDFYARLMSDTTSRVVLDVRGPELLTALPRHPFLVKPNRAELEQTFGRSLSNRDDLLAAMQDLNQMGAEWVLVTQGAGPAWLSSTTEIYRIDPPSIERTVNPIGCGDCLTAGIAVALSESRPMLEAVIFGIAAAVQNAAELLPARLNRDELAHIVRSVKVTPHVVPFRTSVT